MNKLPSFEELLDEESQRMGRPVRFVTGWDFDDKIRVVVCETEGYTLHLRNHVQEVEPRVRWIVATVSDQYSVSSGYVT